MYIIYCIWHVPYIHVYKIHHKCHESHMHVGHLQIIIHAIHHTYKIIYCMHHTSHTPIFTPYNICARHSEYIYRNTYHLLQVPCIKNAYIHKYIYTEHNNSHVFHKSDTYEYIYPVYHKCYATNMHRYHLLNAI